MIHLFFYLGAVAVDAYLRSLPPQHETWEQWSARMAARRLGTIGDRRWLRAKEGESRAATRV